VVSRLVRNASPRIRSLKTPEKSGNTSASWRLSQFREGNAELGQDPPRSTSMPDAAGQSLVLPTTGRLAVSSGWLTFAWERLSVPPASHTGALRVQLDCDSSDPDFLARLKRISGTVSELGPKNRSSHRRSIAGRATKFTRAALLSVKHRLPSRVHHQPDVILKREKNNM